MRRDSERPAAAREPRLSTPPVAAAAPPRWTWLHLPVAAAVVTAILHQVAPEWSWRWLFREGWSVIEMAHFLVPLACAVVAFRAWWRLPRGAGPMLAAMLLVLAAGAFYIAGEEHSWGQHFFGWETPERWAEINRQEETNLHNTTSWLNHKPRVVLNLLVIFATVIVPLMQWAGRGEGLLRRIRFALPGPETRPLGALVIFYMIYDGLAKDGILPKIASREAEMHELFLYGYLLLYAVQMARRIEAWRRQHVAAAAGRPG